MTKSLNRGLSLGNISSSFGSNIQISEHDRTSLNNINIHNRNSNSNSNKIGNRKKINH